VADAFEFVIHRRGPYLDVGSDGTPWAVARRDNT